jgi:hypothetical protein
MMSQLTEEDKLFRTKRRSVYLKWGLVAGALVIAFLTWKGCQNEKVMSSRFAEMEQRLKRVLSDSARIVAVARGYKKAKEDMDLRYAEVTAEKNLLQQKVREDGGKIVSLAKKVKEAANDKDTVTLMDSCIEMAKQIEYYKSWMDEVWIYEVKQDSIQNARIALSNAESAHWKSAYDSCFNAAKSVSAALPAFKPKGKLYIDGSVKIGAVAGVGGGFSYIDAKGNKFSAKGYATNLGPEYEAGYGRLLGFKKRN